MLSYKVAICAGEFPFPSNSIFSWDFCLKWLIIWVVFWSQDLLVCLLLRLQTVLEAFRTSCFFSISGKVMLVRRWGWEDSLLQHWFDPFFISCLQLNLEEAKMHKPTTTRVKLRLGLLSKWARLVSRSVVHSIRIFKRHASSHANF